MKIEQQDLQIFERHFPLFDTIKRANFVRNYTRENYAEMLTLFEKYISKKHSFAFHCGECRFFLVKQLFNFYENELKSQVDEVKDQEAIQRSEEVDQANTEEAIDQTPEEKPEKRKYKKRKSNL